MITNGYHSCHLPAKALQTWRNGTKTLQVKLQLSTVLIVGEKTAGLSTYKPMSRAFKQLL